MATGWALTGGLWWWLAGSGAVSTASATRAGTGLALAWACWCLRRAVWPWRDRSRAFERALRPPARPEADWPVSYREMERTIALACSPQGGHAAEYRLRPILRELAKGRLMLHRGIDLVSEPGRARPLLGDDLFTFLWREQAVPAARLKEAPGVDPRQLEDWLEKLAAI